MKIYVAGAIDHDRWGINRRRRAKVNAALIAAGHEVIDPIDANLEVDKVLSEMKPDKGSDEYSGYIRLIVENDCALVVGADLVFVIYSVGVRKGAGTHGEITLGAWLHKPIVIWSPRHPIKKIPGWVFGCCHPKFMFKKMEDAIRGINTLERLKKKNLKES
jgi:hypothetical protein